MLIKYCIISSLFLSSLPRKLFPEACRVELTQEMMQKADVDPTLRPPELTIPQIRALADAYGHLCTHEPTLLSYEFREELRLKYTAKQRNKPMDEPTSTPPRPQQPCWKTTGTETKRSPLIASLTTGKQQTPLSLDISTWHMHVFLKCFSPCTQEAIGDLVYMKSWDRDNTYKAYKDPGWVGSAPRPCSRMGELKAELCVL